MIGTCPIIVLAHTPPLTSLATAQRFPPNCHREPIHTILTITWPHLYPYHCQPTSENHTIHCLHLILAWTNQPCQEMTQPARCPLPAANDKISHNTSSPNPIAIANPYAPNQQNLSLVTSRPIINTLSTSLLPRPPIGTLLND